MALPFRIGATKKAKLTQGTMTFGGSAKKSTGKKKAAAQPAAKPVASKRKKATLTQGQMKFSTGLSTEAGRVLATKKSGYRSTSNPSTPSPAQRKAGKILAVCRHHGKRTCESPSAVVNVLAKSKSTWKPVGARNTRTRLRLK
jgi:hypothetical protein